MRLGELQRRTPVIWPPSESVFRGRLFGYFVDVLILMRHADAEDESPTTLGDTGRAITPLGRRQAHDSAAWVASLPSAPRLWLTSPLVRTVQTAEALACELPDTTAKVAGELRPGQPAEAAIRLCSHERSMGLVGHAPTIAEIGAQLLERVALPFAFERAACLVLEHTPHGFEFRAYRIPFGRPITAL